MSREASIAPKERVNITYKPATGDATESVELPLKLLVLADLTGHADPRPVEDRRPVAIDRERFKRVMAEQNLSVTTQVPDLTRDAPGASLDVTLRFQGLADFTPDGLAAQVPALEQLLALRRALIALKGPMGNVPGFRRALQQLLGDETARAELVAELAGSNQEGPG